jgi:uncharacterized protein YhdP
MIKNFFKFLLISLVLGLLLLAVVIKNPNIIGFFVEKFTHNSLFISNIDIDIDFNNTTITTSTDTLEFVNKDTTSQASKVQFIVNFQNFNTLTTIDNIDIDYHGLKLSTQLSIETIDNNTFINGSVDTLIVAEVLPYIGVIDFPETINYLQQALQTGYATDVRYTIVHTNGDYDVDISGKINNGYIKFAPKWHHIDAISANFTIDNDKMLIDFDSATIANIVARGVVEVNWEQELFIGVNAKSDTQTEVVLDFLKHQPLPNKLLAALGNFTAKGDTSATVQLHLPIKEIYKKYQLIVNAQTYNNTFALFDGKLTANNINTTFTLDKQLSIVGTGDIFDTPTTIDLHYDDELLIQLQNQLGDLTIKNAQEHIWQASVIGDIAFADLHINTADTPTITLNSLVLDTKTGQDSPMSIDISPQDIGNFNFIANDIIVDERNIPDFATTFVRKKDGIHIQDLHFKDIKIGNKHININGLWIRDMVSFKTTLQGDKLDDLFSSFDIDEHTIGGKFNIDLRGFCKCNPWQLSLDNISGYGKIHIEEGIFSEQDAHIGRILSLLNINSLIKRLELDVGDVVNKGFSYNSIDTEIILATGGIATIGAFHLDSSASKINLRGVSNIVTQTYDLNAEIIPAIKDSIPVATAIAGGGAAGLGVWLIDKFIFQEKLLNSVIGNVANFEYKISGNWDNPIITKIK